MTADPYSPASIARAVERHDDQCPACDGDGECRRCQGFGYELTPVGRGTCDRCSGSGCCVWCGGEGVRP